MLHKFNTQITSKLYNTHISIDTLIIRAGLLSRLAVAFSFDYKLPKCIHSYCPSFLGRHLGLSIEQVYL